MNNKQIFENFLESLKGKGQDTLIESVKKGFRTCFEAEWENISGTNHKMFKIEYKDLNQRLKEIVGLLNVRSLFDAKMSINVSKYKDEIVGMLFVNDINTVIDLKPMRLKEILKDEVSLSSMTYDYNKLSAVFYITEKDIDEMKLLEEKTSEESNRPAEPEPQPPENVS